MCDAGALTEGQFAAIPHDYPGDPRGWGLVKALHAYTRRLPSLAEIQPGDMACLGGLADFIAGQMTVTD